MNNSKKSYLLYQKVTKNITHLQLGLAIIGTSNYIYYANNEFK